MACSRFEYTRKFEQHTTLLPGCWTVLRIDGRGFSRFTTEHAYQKPNDSRGLSLMNAAAMAVVNEFSPDLLLAYGQSDEYSFVVARESALFRRRIDKLLSVLTSLFTAEFVRRWVDFFPNTPLTRTPMFDGRLVSYPTTKHLRDYLAWRQADVHVNNLYNTAFWGLVKTGLSNTDAELRLKGTDSAQKNELLFTTLKINYNNEPEMYRKGSVIVREPSDNDKQPNQVSSAENSETYNRNNSNPNVPKKMKRLRDSTSRVVCLHVDIIRDDFWKQRPHLLHPPDTDPPRIKQS